MAWTLMLGGVATGLAGYLYLRMRRPPGFPPGPLAVPILGSLPFLDLSNDENGYKLYEEMEKMTKKYGPMFSLAFPGRWVVMISDPGLLKEAFMKQGVKFAGRQKVGQYKEVYPHFPLVGVVDGTYSEQWKLQRHTVIQVLRNLGYGRNVTENLMMEEAQSLIDFFTSRGKKDIELNEFIAKAVANIMSALLFGERYDFDDEEFKVLHEATGKAFKCWEKITEYDEMPLASLSPTYNKLKRELISAYDKINGIIHRKIAKNDLLGDIEEPTNFIQGYRNERRKNPSIENRLHENIQDFIQAGMETTSTTLGWAFYFMIAYPDVQRKCQEELDRVVGRSRRPRLSDREECIYVSATLLEILRLGCTAPTTIPHVTLEDAKVGDFLIPKGTEVVGNIWGIMRSPSIWPEPLVLKPERFIDVDGKLKNHESFIPFSIGRRVCLGEQLARQELFIFFATLIHGLDFSCPPEEKLPEPIGHFALTHQPPKYKVCVTSRD